MATRTVLRELYEGESRRAVRFRYGLLLFDLSTIFYLAVTSFVGGSPFLGTGPRGGEGMTFTELSPDELADPVALLQGRR